ncbi:Arm DNA-binding domain-containing protein [Xanthomonas campestris]
MYSDGLYLEASPKGGRWWGLKYRFGGKEKRLALGVYPDVPLAPARQRRDEAPAARTGRRSWRAPESSNGREGHPRCKHLRGDRPRMAWQTRLGR